ncbi:UBX domain-containing protein [Pilobolus umbonatus]|nr:UBX domain-containing protein [Pilobolus umbonatus]
MLVYLHSRDHDDTDEFCRHTLSTARVGNFIKDKNILLWGGDVREGEAHKVSYALKASTYPFMALIALQNTLGSSSPKMTVIERIEGPSHPEELISQIEIAIDRHGAVVNRLKNEKNQREMERQLRDDQDRAYKESLKADQEKEKDAQLKAEEEAKDREMERQLSEQKREQYNRYLFNQLAEETKEQDPSKITRLNFRLADGSRVVRKFDKDATLDTLYKFVEIYPLLKEGKHEHQPVEPPLDYEHKFNFTIHSPYPRMEYEPSSSTKLCEISSLWPSATLVVDAVVDEDDEDDDME